MFRVGLATCAQVPDLTADDRLLLDELRRRGADARAVVWDAPSVPWAAFDSVVIRSCWDYHLRTGQFLAWMSALEDAGVPLWNPAGLVRWNHHKRYLQDLERSGVPIVPTVFLERGARVSIAGLLEERGWTEAVVKPAVSASAYRTFRVTLESAGPAQEAAAGIRGALEDAGQHPAHRRVRAEPAVGRPGRGRRPIGAAHRVESRAAAQSGDGIPVRAGQAGRG